MTNDATKIDPTPIIDAFGGVTPMSFATEIAAATITSWQRRGHIPHWWSAAILKGARKKKIDTTAWGLK